MRAGRLRRRVVIEEPSNTADGQGGLATPAWSTYKTLSAAIVPVKGDEVRTAGKVAGVGDVRIIVRYQNGIVGVVQGMRVRDDLGAVYFVEGMPDVDERRTEITLWCRRFEGETA